MNESYFPTEYALRALRSFYLLSWPLYKSLKRPAFGVREGINISRTVYGFFLEIASPHEVSPESVIEA